MSKTRKPSWRKGKRAIAVRVWRPLANKSTANQRYAISYRWLIVTVAALLTVCEIFSGVEVENRHFRPLYCDCRPIVEETQQYQRNLCIAEKYRSIFIRFAVVALSNLRNHAKFRENSNLAYSSSKSSKVIDVGVNRSEPRWGPGFESRVLFTISNLFTSLLILLDARVNLFSNIKPVKIWFIFRFRFILRLWFARDTRRYINVLIDLLIDFSSFLPQTFHWTSQSERRLIT